MERSVWDGPAGKEMRTRFRAESEALRARIEAARPGGRHAHEKGMRVEEEVIRFLQDVLPPRFGVARGEIMDSRGHVSRQCDVVIYDALHTPRLQRATCTLLVPAESVYAVIEMKPKLSGRALPQAVEIVRSAKALDRSAIVTHHQGHERVFAGPAANPPIFGAVLSTHMHRAGERLAPQLIRLHRKIPREQWVDCVCVLGDTLVYHFQLDPKGRGIVDWVPSVLCEDSRLGYYESGEDTLLLFVLFLLWQLNAKSLWPPDLIQYASGLKFRGPRIHLGEGDPRLTKPPKYPLPTARGV